MIGYWFDWASRDPQGTRGEVGDSMLGEGRQPELSKDAKGTVCRGELCESPSPVPPPCILTGFTDTVISEAKPAPLGDGQTASAKGTRDCQPQPDLHP